MIGFGPGRLTRAIGNGALASLHIRFFFLPDILRPRTNIALFFSGKILLFLEPMPQNS